MGGLPDNYYMNKMKHFNVSKTETGFKLNLNFTPLGMKLDKAQDALDDAIWSSVERRMPVGAFGNLKNRTNVINRNVRGEVWLYDPEVIYAHYQYEGRTMVDPITGSPWSRPDAIKVYVSDYSGDHPIKTREYLQYSQPNARRLWGREAFADEDEWMRAVERAMKE